MRPILFNTEMVRAILEGKKSVTRRINKDLSPYDEVFCYDFDRRTYGITFKYPNGEQCCQAERSMPYTPGDILYARETLYISPTPKKAARILLKVTGVRVERLQDITEEQIIEEGLSPYDDRCADENWKPSFYDPDSGGTPQLKQGYEILWDSTVKKSDLDKYSWDANPWVWVIEFERIEKPNEL